MISKMYLALVRPYLYHTAQFWSLFDRMDIETLERVPWRISEMIHSYIVYHLGHSPWYSNIIINLLNEGKPQLYLDRLTGTGDVTAWDEYKVSGNHLGKLS